MRILVIEDDRAVQETLKMVLESCDHQAAVVNDGKEAVQYLQGQWPDAVLLDLTLQEMSGEEVYQMIRDRFGKVPPTIVLSADQAGADRTRRMLGARFLAKPYTIDDLDHVLQEVANAQSAA